MANCTCRETSISNEKSVLALIFFVLLTVCVSSNAFDDEYNLTTAEYSYNDISQEEGTKLTGTLTGLDANADYTYYWYNPRTTATSEPAKVNKDGTNFTIGERPSAEDWVLVVQKTK